jgi:hypothetical protein
MRCEIGKLSQKKCFLKGSNELVFMTASFSMEKGKKMNTELEI